jgi:hypothetical protein
MENLSVDDIFQFVVSLPLADQFRLRQLLQPLELDLVSVLPTELRFQVFSYLDAASISRCERVSKSWNEYFVGSGPAHHFDAYKAIVPLGTSSEKVKTRAVETYLAEQRWNTGTFNTKFGRSTEVFSGLKLLDLRALGSANDGYLFIGILPSHRALRIETFPLSSSVEGYLADIPMDVPSFVDARVLDEPWEFEMGEGKAPVLVTALVVVGHASGLLSLFSLKLCGQEMPSLDRLTTFGGPDSFLHASSIFAVKILGNRKILTYAYDGVICVVSWGQSNAFVRPTILRFKVGPVSGSNWAVNEVQDILYIPGNAAISLSGFPETRSGGGNLMSPRDAFLLVGEDTPERLRSSESATIVARGVLGNRGLFVDHNKDRVFWIQLEWQANREVLDLETPKHGVFDFGTSGSFPRGVCLDAITVKSGEDKEVSVIAIGKGSRWRRDRGGVVLLEI